MTAEFYSGNVWPEITRKVQGAGQTFAAISFVGSNAPKLLPLGDADVLVVNGGTNAIRSRATNPYVLEEFYELGVEIYSSNRLHAKVIATDQHAIIGSANVSMNSTRQSEAVVISNSREERNKIKSFVKDEIKQNGVELTLEKIRDLQTLFDESPTPAMPIPGVNEPENKVTGFPWHLGPVYLVESNFSNLTDDEEEEFLAGASLPTGFVLQVTQIDKSIEPFNRGDIVIFFDRKSIYAPIYIDSDLRELASDSSRRAQISQQKVNHRRSYVISGMDKRYMDNDETIQELIQDAVLNDGSIELRGRRRDSLLRVWFPNFDATAE